MAKLDLLVLRVQDPDAQRAFYCDVLGMSDLGDGRIGYSDKEVALKFVKAHAPYGPQPTDLYWKIAISVPNIELAASQLSKHGVSVTPPAQFRDVGFLAKATDPEGFVIELIDHYFEGDRPVEGHDAKLLGGGPHISLVTLRIADIAAIEPELLSWGMTPLSVQPVTPFGFTLHFYAFTEERPPCSNLEAVENRCWTYQRPYSVLEIQHVHEMTSETIASPSSSGFERLEVSGAGRIIQSERLCIQSN